MKTTGVIRRIDSLGRIVIPKEIRQYLKIREGEPLEILVDKECMVLKKYSTLGKFEQIASILSKSFFDLTKNDIFISDCDVYIAASNSIKQLIINKPLSPYIDQIINNRKQISNDTISSLKLTNDCVIDSYYVINPIIVNGDVIGMVGILSKNKVIDERNIELLFLISTILSKNIDN